MPSEHRATYDARTGAMLDLLTELVQIESPTSDKAAVDRMGVRVRAELEDLGAVITVHPRE